MYGSESKLLSKMYEKKNVQFIRIYKTRKPKPLENAIDVNTIMNFEKEFIDFFKKEKVKKIIFIGAAFIVQNALFIKEKKQNIDVMIKTNVTSYVNFAHFLIPYMIKIKSGNFIFLSSFRSKATTRGVSIYSASKSFCESFFEVIGKEYGALGVFSNSIRLGCFDGRMFEVVDDEKKKRLISAVGNRRLGTSEDLMKAIEFLVDSNYSNAGVLDLSAGISYY